MNTWDENNEKPMIRVRVQVRVRVRVRVRAKMRLSTYRHRIPS